MLTNYYSTDTNLISNEVFENKIDEVHTKQTLAQKLKFSVSYINKLMRQRKIPYLKNGRSVRFILSEVMAALQQGSAV